VEGPGDGASDDVEEAGDENERTSATGSGLKRARRGLLGILEMWHPVEKWPETRNCAASTLL
jgi:hypothetical protein